jgi:hypothetical protein
MDAWRIISVNGDVDPWSMLALTSLMMNECAMDERSTKVLLEQEHFCGPVSDYEPTRFDFLKHQIGENRAGGLLQKHQSGVLRIKSGGLTP